MYQLHFSSSANRTLALYKKSNPILFKKVSKILVELMEHPRQGIGRPEPLVNGDGITYSRRITAHDRIIYDVYDDQVVVLVLSIGGHYSDK